MSNGSSRKTIRAAVRGVAAVGGGVLLAGVCLALIPPAGRPTLPPDAVIRGEALEQALVAAVTKVRDPAGEEWAIDRKSVV